MHDAYDVLYPHKIDNPELFYTHSFHAGISRDITIFT